MKIISLSIISIFVIQASCAKVIDKISPNVIIVMTDDQGYGDLSCNGNPYVETPNMDGLKDDSTSLENFHVFPTCSPTRAALMTGKYPHRVGVWHTVLGRERIRKSELTMADIFAQNGYVTGIFGKWHLGDDYPYRPSDRGFEESVINKAGSVSQMADYWNNDRMNDSYYHNNKVQKYNGFSSDVFFEEAMEFIKTNKNKPFFAYIPTSTPHGPNNVQQKWADKYIKKGCSEDVANFYASIEKTDLYLGKLLHFLKKQGLEKNTIFIFLTDNGSAMSNKHNKAGMRGAKGSAYEGGHRVPCFIRWPKKLSSTEKECLALSSVMDLLPTFVDICQLEINKDVHFDGLSLAPLLFGHSNYLDERDLLVETQRLPHPEKWKSCALIHKNWRLINGKSLYDMEVDFSQKNDVSEKYPEIVKTMRAKYEKIWTSISQNDDEYHRLIIGSKESPETLLTAQDWYWSNNSDKQNLIVSQAVVREGRISNGTWPVEIESKGIYSFELRRYPKESGLSLGSSAPEIQSEKNDIALKKWGKKPKGKKFNINKAAIEINGIRKELEVDGSKQFVRFNMKLQKGPADIQTWFYTDEKEVLGAYYVYVKRNLATDTP